MNYTVTSSLPDPKGTARNVVVANYTKDQFAVTKRTANETVYTATEAGLGTPCTIRLARENVNNVYANIDQKINTSAQLANKQGTQVLIQINDILKFEPESDADGCCAEAKYAPIKANLVFRIPNASEITPAILFSRVRGIMDAIAKSEGAVTGESMLNWAKGSLALPFDM